MSDTRLPSANSMMYGSGLTRALQGLGNDQVLPMLDQSVQASQQYRDLMSEYTNGWSRYGDGSAMQRIMAINALQQRGLDPHVLGALLGAEAASGRFGGARSPADTVQMLQAAERMFSSPRDLGPDLTAEYLR